MSNQNRTTIDKLNSDIRDLKRDLEDQKQMVVTKEEQIRDLNLDHQNKLAKKDEEIHGLKRKIDDMSNEFAEMLKVGSGMGLLIKRKLLRRCNRGSRYHNGTHKLIRENIPVVLFCVIALDYPHLQPRRL